MFTSVLFAMPQMDSSTFTMFLSSIHPLRSQLTALTLRAYTIHLALSRLCCVLLEIFYSWVWLNCHVPEGKVHSLRWLDPSLPQGALPVLGTDGGRDTGPAWGWPSRFSVLSCPGWDASSVPREAAAHLLVPPQPSILPCVTEPLLFSATLKSAWFIFGWPIASALPSCPSLPPGLTCGHSPL